MSRRRLFALIVVLALGLLSVLAPRVAAQTAAQRFEQVIANRDQLPVIAGPFDDFDLVQEPGVLTVYRAGLDIPDFVAHAVFTNPTVDTNVAWEYGFQFRTTGNNEDFRIFAVSDGSWNFAIGVEPPEQTVAAVNLNTEPGESNTLDLSVEGFQAIFGINGQFAGTILLPELAPTGDIFASTGFFSNLSVADRAIGLSEFTIYGLPRPGSLPGSVKAGLAATGGPTPPRPVTLHSGSCAALGIVVEELTDATYPIGTLEGQPSAVVSETSFTRVPRPLDDLLLVPYAINVAESFEAPGTSIACGDIGGILDEIGAYVIALPERNGSGYRGVAYVAPDPTTDLSSISVFLAPPVSAAAVESATPLPDVATPVAVVPEATPPRAVITVEGLPEQTPEASIPATPVG